MTFKRTLYAGVLALTLASTQSAVIFCDEPVQQKINDSDILKPENINSLMQRKTVDDILTEEYESGLIEKIVFDKKTKKLNFYEKVYQEQIPEKQRMPYIVYFTDSKNRGHDINNIYPAEKRMAIILKILSKKYSGNINFVIFDPIDEPEFKELSGNEASHGPISKGEGLAKFGMPLTIIYSPFDVVKGETPTNNDGKIKKIDVLMGGPKTDKWIIEWLSGDKGAFAWIETNITNINGRYAVRVNNSADPVFAFYEPQVFKEENKK